MIGLVEWVSLNVKNKFRVFLFIDVILRVLKTKLLYS